MTGPCYICGSVLQRDDYEFGGVSQPEEGT